MAVNLIALKLVSLEDFIGNKKEIKLYYLCFLAELHIIETIYYLWKKTQTNFRIFQRYEVLELKSKFHTMVSEDYREHQIIA